MGATNATITYQTDDRAKVQKAFRADTERARFEDGHDPYSGSIGQKTGIGRWAPSTFATAEEAEEWVMDHSDKWDSDAAAAHYYVPTKPSKAQEERARKASEKRRKAEDAAAQARREAEAAIYTAKSKTIGCKGCGSTLSRQHLRGKLGMGNGYASAGCPLCGHNLLSKTAVAAIKRACAKVDKAKAAEDKAHQALRKPSKKRGTIVGGWVAC